MTIQNYLDLITAEYQNQPKFKNMVSFMVSLPVQVQVLLASMIAIFDLDNPPIGAQLDILGQWVGASRNVAVPISGVYFTWDGTDYTVGWDFGSWQPINAPTEITVLPDDAYLSLVRAKIAANQWDGTTDGAYKIWDAIFPQFTILINDHQDMSYDMAFVGGIVDSLTLALIVGGYIPLRPEGVRINEYFVPVDSNPLFAWDIANAFLGGWDTSSWAREIFT